jgi:hypothetical protein
MANAQWNIRSPGEQAAKPAPKSADREAQERFERQVQEKLAEGYRIESRSDTKVVLVEEPRRWLGITLPGKPSRVAVTLDQ